MKSKFDTPDLDKKVPIPSGEERYTNVQHDASPINSENNIETLSEASRENDVEYSAPVVPLVQRDRPSRIEKTADEQNIEKAKIVGELNFAFASGKAPLPSKGRDLRLAKALHEGSPDNSPVSGLVDEIKKDQSK